MTRLRTEPEAEKIVLGSLLRTVSNGDQRCVQRVFGEVSHLDFSDEGYAKIVGAIESRWKRGEPFDSSLLIAELRDEVKDVAGVLLDCAQAAPTTGWADAHVQLVKAAAEQRALVCAATDAINQASNGKAGEALPNLKAAIERIEGKSKRVRRTTPKSGEPFPVDTLPAVVGQFVSAAAGAIGCDLAFVALPVLGCLARAIGNRRVVQLKATWTEPAIIWGAFVGKSGTHKSPALATATQPLHIRQGIELRQLSTDLEGYERERACFERDMQNWRKAKGTEPPPVAPQQPSCNRFVVGDTTIEAAASVLSQQFDGVLMVRDELAGWLEGIAEYKGGKGSDTAHWLAAWSGAPLVVDRKTGTQKLIHIPRASVSIVGGIQPAVLRRAIGREHMQDGLCARLLLAMPEPKPVRWTDATVPDSVQAGINRLIDRLLCAAPAVDDAGQQIPFAMPLTAEAKTSWVEFYNQHRAEIPALDDDLAAAWSKLEAYAARFALIFQLCSWATDGASDWEVDQQSVESGIALSEWFCQEARRVYGVMSETDQQRQDRELVELVNRKGGSTTVRQLMRSTHRFATAEDAEAALDSLARNGWGRWRSIPSGPKGGAPTREFCCVTPSDTDETTESNGEYLSCVNVNGGTEAESLAAFEAERRQLSVNGAAASVPF